MTKRVLLVGTSFSAAPLLHGLRRLGHRVEVCGSLSWDPCVAQADAHHVLDYSDASALRDLIAAEGFDAVCPSCNDYAYLSVAAAAAEFGLPGFDDPDTTAILHDKARFRAYTGGHGYPAPRAVLLAEGAEPPVDLRYPLLVKPTDSFSGRGMTRLDHPDRLPAALAAARQASRGGRVLVEEFVEGSLHSHSAFLRDRDILADFFVDEFCTAHPYQVNCSNAPSLLPEAARARMRDCIRDLARALGLADGLLHTQFLVRDSEVFLVECMRRCPGDLYYLLVSRSTGVPYVDNYLRPFLGEAPDCPAAGAAVPWARHTVSLDRDAVVWSFTHAIPSDEVHIHPLRESGSLVRRAPYDKLAILFARFDDLATLARVTPKLRDLVHLETAEPHHVRH